MDYSINWIAVIYIINGLFAFTLIFLERKDPTATLTWLLVLTFLPIIGFIFYMLTYQNFNKKELFKLNLIEEKILNNYIKRQKNKFANNNLYINDEKMKCFEDLIELNLIYNNSYYSTNNKIDIYYDGKLKFDSLINSLENAKNHIHMEYFIIRSDTLGKKIVDILTKKAKEGIEVRLLFDSFGGRNLKNKTLKPLLNAGGKIGIFFPGNIPLLNHRINFRNHRKIVVIDGLEAYLGGFNIGNEYIGDNKKIGYWRDTHIKITGSAVKDVQTRFLLDWRSASKNVIGFEHKYFPEISDFGTSGIQIVSSGPESKLERIKINFLKMISLAKKSIYIQTPYFVPDKSIIESIKIASMSGVDVHIMIPNKPDHPLIYWTTYFNAGELLDFGVKIYTYENGFLHSKVIVVDDTICSVGTANFDIRSFKLNFEVNAIIYDSQKSIEIKNMFLEDVRSSRILTKEIYAQRDITIKFRESISRLFSQIM